MQDRGAQQDFVKGAAVAMLGRLVPCGAVQILSHEMRNALAGTAAQIGKRRVGAVQGHGQSVSGLRGRGKDVNGHSDGIYSQLPTRSHARHFDPGKDKGCPGCLVDRVDNPTFDPALDYAVAKIRIA